MSHSIRHRLTTHSGLFTGATRAKGATGATGATLRGKNLVETPIKLVNCSCLVESTLIKLNRVIIKNSVLIHSN